MALKASFAAAAGLALMIGSPCLAFSGQQAPSYGASAPSDPDKVHANMFRDLVASGVRTEHSSDHKAMVTYDVTQKASTAKEPVSAPEGRDLIAADPRDPRVNPFLGQ